MRTTSRSSYLRRWRRLLGADVALTSVVSYLLPQEAVCLLVFALDEEYEPLVRFLYAHTQLLAYGDASRRFTSVLHCAAAHGYANVMQRLLRFRLSHPSLLNVKKQARKSIWKPTTGSARSKVLAWCLRNTAYEFPAEVVYEAARQGDLEMLAWLDSCCQYERYRAMEYAGSIGNLESVMWLFNQETKKTQHVGKTQPNDVVILMVQSFETTLQVINWVTIFPRRKCFREVFASRAGYLAEVYDQRDPLLPWTDEAALRTVLARRRYRALDTAAARGDFAMVKRLHEDGRWPCTSRAMDMAAANGHLEIVQFLHENRREGGTAVGMCSAAGNGHLNVVQWLYQHRNDGCRAMVLDLAATNGHIDVLRWLAPRFPRFSCSSAFLPSVAAQGNLETLQYLHKDMHMALDLRTLEAAIGSGHFELVKYVADHLSADIKLLVSSTAAERAAASGNVHVLAFVVEELGLWSPQVLTAAAPTGNLKMAQWILKQSQSVNVFESAPKRMGRERRSRAATSNAITGMIMDPSSPPCKRRLSHDEVTAMAVARPLDIVDGRTLYRCASLGYFDMLEWLLKHDLASLNLALSMKKCEIVLRSMIGQNATDEHSVTRVSHTNSGPRSDDKRSSFDRFAWALPVKTSPFWQIKFLHLALEYCPDSALKLEWMPLWAAQRGDLFVLKRLYAVKHPHLFTRQTFLAILRYTKAGDVLQWFQTHSPTLIGDPSVVEWGVKYRQFVYLTYLFVTFQPVRNEERLRQHGVEYALYVASALGYLDVVTWICGNCEIFLHVPAAELHAKLGRLSIWKDALLGAARFGQIGILTWVHEKFTFFLEVPTSCRKLAVVKAMADTAATYGQLRVLRWLQAHVAPQLVLVEEGGSTISETSSTIETSPRLETSFVSTEGLLKAVQNRHVDVVQWVCAVDLELVGQQTSKRRGELATFLKEETDGFVPSRLGFVFPPL